MLLDGVTLVAGSEIQNVHVESGTTFPVGPAQGRMFYLTTASGGNSIGLYVFDGTSWITGDITSLTAGSGLTGGGVAGDISFAVDTSVIATNTSVSTALGVVSGDLATHTADATVHLTSAQNTLLDGLNGSLTSAEVNYLVGVTGAVQTQIDSKVAKAGDTMTGNLVMQAEQTITVPTPTGGFTASNAVNRAYVDALASGLTWLNPILDPDLMDDSLSAPPVSPVVNAVYLIGATASGAWTGLEGHAVYWSGTAWVDILGRVVAVGDRFGVTMEHGSGTEGGNMATHHNDIAQVTNATPGSYAYTFTTPLSGQATFVNNASSQHFGHSYVYDSASTAWIEFGGPNATPAGVGLGYTGNVLNVNLGAGVAELPTDEVGLDLYSASGLMLTLDGTTPSSATAAQLAVKVDGTTLTRSANGLKVADVGYNVFTATASQTVFTFSGFTNVVGSHRLMVFVSGIKQLESAYTETTTDITLSTGLTAGTSVEIYFR